MEWAAPSRLVHAALAASVLSATVAQAAPARPGAAIEDKTLVAWVAAANLTQRGGSVLTLIDPAERFDAIVLGEVAAARWMAGSDYFRRTHRDQTAWPAEDADAKTQVQVAITYHGKRITLYRNGARYAAYDVGQPQSFGDDAMVLIGLRYIGQMGEIGPFVGAIEDARIYGAALAAEQIAALKPNEVSDPRPLAWWHFENGTSHDAMKTFPAVRLMGTATVADGKLHLDGDGYLWAARDEKPLRQYDDEEATLQTTVQTLFYKARSRRTGRMWDTWLYLHQGAYYLYYLAKAGGQWDNVSMATSPDGVHWKEVGRILRKGRGVTWMGTGSTWRSPRFDEDGKFLLNFSEWKGPRQTIFFAESKDLLHWTRLGNECEFVQDERWYQRNGRWDCIWTLPKPDGSGLYGYWTATPKPETGGRFGFGESRDGVTWAALPPPKVHGVGGGEVGAIEKIGGRYYMMFGHFPTMRTLVADKPEGPFHAAPRNPVLLHQHTYFSRFLPTPDGVLVNHHSIARNGEVYLAPLKAAHVDRDGTLRLAWWRGNDRLKREAVAVRVPAGAPRDEKTPAMLDGTLDAERGVILEGDLALPDSDASPRRGLYVECRNQVGGAILFDSKGRAALGTTKADAVEFKAEKTVDREIAFGKPARVRLLLKHSLLECYLDDFLIECFSLPADATGRIGLICGDDARSFGNLKAWLP